MNPVSGGKDQQTEKLNNPAPAFSADRFTNTYAASGAASPLEALRKSVAKTVAEGRKEAAAKAAENGTATPTAAEPVKVAEPVKAAEPVKTFEPKKPETPVAVKLFKEEEPTPAAPKTSSLLAKCMPYISDEQGNAYVEEKPNYTLQSVETIIESAEKRADEKLARMYNIKKTDIQRIGTNEPETPAGLEPEQKATLRQEETSFARPQKIGDVAVSTSKYDTVSFPKLSSTLFDDFSARRTDSNGEEKVATPYSEVNTTPENNHTRILPELKPKTEQPQVFEDISSRSKPTADIWSSKKQVNKLKSISDEAPKVEVKEFGGAADVKRVGSDLKLDLVLAKGRFFITFALALVAAALHLPVFEDLLSGVACGIASVVFGLALIFNLNIFGSFKELFKGRVKAELPLAVSVLLMAIYFVFGIATAAYPWQPAILPLASLLVYNYCVWRKATAIFGNFKIVAARKGKEAITLISDPATTSAMARSAIKGEVVAAASRPSNEFSNFLKNTMSDRSLADKGGAFTIISLVFAAVISLVVGVSHASFENAMLAAATIMCMAAAPSLFVADMLPFAGLCDRLHRLKAGVCSKYSAEQIEHINAVTVSSADLFPAGSIKLYNISPLSANPLDHTLAMAAAVAYDAKSPLYPLFASILTDNSELPPSDSVKYEENLGISGWADDHHIMIGNRSLMEAHGVRVPALDVDRKILHKGYFPIYLACDQRACAMFVVKYSINRKIETELGRLADKGVLILVENCDPNITEQMLCDYYSLFPDSLKILDHNGSHKYNKATEPCEITEAHGFTRGSFIGYISAISGSFRLRRLSNLLYILHIVTMVISWLMFAALSLGGSLTLMSAVICALCELVSLVVTLTAYFIGK